jgi:hypothetical protein
LKSLEAYYNLTKALIEMKDKEILSALMSDHFFNYTFGSLEWNPNYPGH